MYFLIEFYNFTVYIVIYIYINICYLDEYVVTGQNTFDEYEIYVQAANDVGTTKLNRLKKRYGYAGEGGK